MLKIKVWEGDGGCRLEDGGWNATWGSSASLNNGEFLMRGLTIAASFPGEDGRFCQSLGQTGGHERTRVNDGDVCYNILNITILERYSIVH